MGDEIRAVPGLDSYEVEFQRFPEGHLYTFRFTPDGEIMSATIYVLEMDRPGCNGEINVFDFVLKDKYWQMRVDDWLVDQKKNKIEQKYFKAFKDVINK